MNRLSRLMNQRHELACLQQQNTRLKTALQEIQKMIEHNSSKYIARHAWEIWDIAELTKNLEIGYTTEAEEL